MTENELDRYMRLYYRSVYNTALCCCKNPCDADDVAQDVFLALYLRGDIFESEKQLRSWLLRCAYNKSIDIIRSHWHKFSVPLENGYSDLSCDDKYASELLETVMSLGKKYRAVLYLYYYEEYSVGEIADILRISEAAVRTRMQRGRGRLKKILENERN